MFQILRNSGKLGRRSTKACIAATSQRFRVLLHTIERKKPATDNTTMLYPIDMNKVGFVPNPSIAPPPRRKKPGAWDKPNSNPLRTIPPISDFVSTESLDCSSAR